MSGHKSEVVQSGSNTISHREHLYILAMVSGGRERQGYKLRLCLKRVPSSEEIIVAKLVCVDDG